MELKEILERLDLTGYPKILPSTASMDEINKSASAGVVTCTYELAIEQGKTKDEAACAAADAYARLLATGNREPATENEEG